MPKTKISEFSATAGNNTDIDGINISEGCPPSGINDAIRELMAQLKDFQSGGAGDSMTAVGTLAAKGTSSSGADLQLYEDTDNGTNYVALKAPSSIASNVTWTLPSADGTNGQALITNGSGTLSFATISASPGGSTTQVQYNNAGAFAGSANMTFDGTSLTLGGNPTLSAGTANGVAYLNGSKVLTTGSALTYNGTSFGVGSSAYGDAGTITTSIGVPGTTAGGLQLWASSAQEHYIQWGDSTSGSATYAGAISYSHASDFMRFWTNSSEQMRLTSTGLGIGTSSPAVKLHVSGAGSTEMRVTNTTASLNAVMAAGTASMDFGTNTNHRIDFYTNSSLRATLDTSGNLGLGVTPSAVSASDRVLQVRNFLFDDNTNGYGILRYNNYYNGTNDVYLNTGAASAFQMQGNAFKWYQAASGTAGNTASFTQAMTLDASGNLGVGTTSPAASASYRCLHIDNQAPVSGAQIRITSVGTGSTSNDGFSIAVDSSGQADIYQRENSALTFGTNSTERARITSGGDLIVNGTSTVDNSRIQFYGAKTYSGEIPQGLLNIADTTAYNTALVGGGVAFSAKYNSAGFYTTMGSVEGVKENTTDGNYAGALLFRTRASFGNNAERARITSSGNFGIGTTNPLATLTVSNGSNENFEITTGNVTFNGGVIEYLNRANTTTRPDFNYYLGNNGGSHKFYTTGTERARIDSSGRFLVGQSTYSTTTDGVALQASGSVFARSGTGNSTNINLCNGNGVVGTISTSGTSTAYNTSSDYRLKENQQPLTGSGAFIDALQPKTWNWKTDGTKGVGFIAHEVQEVSPASVTGTKDAVDEEGNPIMQGMEYGSAEFIANIISELQSLRQRVAALEAK